jgi:hypothetical protein
MSFAKRRQTQPFQGRTTLSMKGGERSKEVLMERRRSEKRMNFEIYRKEVQQ